MYLEILIKKFLEADYPRGSPDSYRDIEELFRLNVI